jgi:glycosyltransferase involved in cell wall biosynthesis
MNTNQKVLLLTLVHPDFLPPVYAMARVLRDEGYAVDIVTFNSLVPANYGAGQGIQIVEIGQYHEQPFLKKMGLWRKFYAVVEQKVREQPALIISYCSFSFLCAEAKRKHIPHAYVALEINNTPETFEESPLTFLRIRRTFSNISRADLIATPSHQRSAWLAGKCGLKDIPYTIQNTSYYEQRIQQSAEELLKDTLPTRFKGKKTLLYTGRINENYRVKEIAEAFDKLADPDATLIITGFRANDQYCVELTTIIERLRAKDRILLLPIIPREQMEALQEYADIGICFMNELEGTLATQMAAPNKIGEYIAKGLYLLTNNIVYTHQFRNAGVATLVNQPTVGQVCEGMRDALDKVNGEDIGERISRFYKEEYCMQKQLGPIIDFLKERQSVVAQ